MKYFKRILKSSPASKESKGIFGEISVDMIIGSNITNEKYIINSLIITDEEKSSQIDHIIINKNGIFVIETKSCGGTVFGKENARTWMQYLKGGKVKNLFYNPILQNKSHIKYLSKILEIDESLFTSIIVFTNAFLKTKTETIVGYPDIIEKSIYSKTDNIISIDQMNCIHNKLLSCKYNPKINENQHIKNVDNIKEKLKPKKG